MEALSFSETSVLRRARRLDVTEGGILPSSALFYIPPFRIPALEMISVWKTEIVAFVRCFVTEPKCRYFFH
jgi:hypothetical protein